MKIELKNLKIAASLSEETTAYTATIYIDGVAAFHASNHGHGAPDSYDRMRGYAGPDERAINAWLAENTAPNGPFEADPAKRAAYDDGSPYDLESLVGDLINDFEGEKEWKRRIMSRIAVLRPKGIATYPAALKPTPENIAKIRAQMLAKGDVEGQIINDGDAALIARAKLAYGLKPTADREEEVYARLRENRLTAADCRYLIAQDRKAAKPDADLIAMLEKIRDEQEARHAAYRAEIDASHAAARAEREARQTQAA